MSLGGVQPPEEPAWAPSVAWGSGWSAPVSRSRFWMVCHTDGTRLGAKDPEHPISEMRPRPAGVRSAGRAWLTAGHGITRSPAHGLLPHRATSS